MSKLPPLRKKGERIPAEDHNGVVRFLRGIGRIRGGKGVLVTHSSSGIRISLDAPPEYVLPAVISVVHAPDGASATQDLNLVTYDVKIKGRPEFDDFTNLSPMYGRPDTGVDGKPAQVGDDCDIRVRRRGNDQEIRLHVFTEKTIHQQCDPPAAAATSSALVTGLMAEIARLSARLGALEGQSPVASGQLGGTDG